MVQTLDEAILPHGSCPRAVGMTWGRAAACLLLSLQSDYLGSRNHIYLCVLNLLDFSFKGGREDKGVHDLTKILNSLSSNSEM